MLDTLEITTDEDIPGLLVLIDFEKAFDTVSWKFLHRTLEFFNFGEHFRRWIHLLYTSPLCCVSNNGHATEFFEISRGIRQGCPISALLFILVPEVLAINIRQRDDIKGLQFANNTIKISQLADDTCPYLKDIKSLEATLQLFVRFESCAGLSVNREKTEVVWLGKHTKKAKVLGIKVVDKPIKGLGIWMSKSAQEGTRINFEERLQKVKQLLNMWKQRNLTLKGKITILRTKVLPLLLYVTSVLFTPEDVLEEIDQMLYDFV